MTADVDTEHKRTVAHREDRGTTLTPTIHSDKVEVALAFSRLEAVVVIGVASAVTEVASEVVEVEIEAASAATEADMVEETVAVIVEATADEVVAGPAEAVVADSAVEETVVTVATVVGTVGDRQAETPLITWVLEAGENMK